ncbi:DUF6371 domain-containing protein [Psychroserpens sp. Hel_I_66]|uniref:DUF6371 domain-containing protein n=1 Tax=Psychroserpens sp. Hel_I_66 TaxID=1250004 RepID=UPI000646CF93|nr:DUF6371 domain-containing protein [Psychroserpens sp. Hel_I_66]
MNQFKYSLDKSSKKFSCPSCHKKSFVRYTDNEEQCYLEANVGRCDRESKCQYHLKPNGNVSLVSLTGSVVKQPSHHDINVLSSFGVHYNNNNFITYLTRHFCNVDIIKAIKKYFIGTSTHWNGATIFWQVNEYMEVYCGKVMLYDTSTGKRVKRPYTHISWMHKVLCIQGFVQQQCLFGLHNLCDYSVIHTICIVESEKTAIIMSILFPGELWLATGSKNNFKEQLLRPVKQFKIIMFPDKTEFVDWNTKTENLKKQGYNILCSGMLEGKDLDEGDDLVDLVVSHRVLI